MPANKKKATKQQAITARQQKKLKEVESHRDDLLLSWGIQKATLERFTEAFGIEVAQEPGTNCLVFRSKTLLSAKNALVRAQIALKAELEPTGSTGDCQCTSGYLCIRCNSKATLEVIDESLTCLLQASTRLNSSLSDKDLKKSVSRQTPARSTSASRSTARRSSTGTQRNGKSMRGV